MFSTAAAPFYLPKCTRDSSLFTDILKNNNPPNRCEVVSHYSFDFHFPNNLKC